MVTACACKTLNTLVSQRVFIWFLNFYHRFYSFSLYIYDLLQVYSSVSYKGNLTCRRTTHFGFKYDCLYICFRSIVGKLTFFHQILFDILFLNELNIHTCVVFDSYCSILLMCLCLQAIQHFLNNRSSTVTRSQVQIL